MKRFRGRQARTPQNPQPPGDTPAAVPVNPPGADHSSDYRFQQATSDLTDAHMRQTLSRWSQGLDAGAGRQLIGYFHRQMQQPDYNPELLLQFIGEAFERMVAEGMTADQAFRLNHPEPESSPHESLSPQDRAIALTVEHQKRFDPYRGALKRAYVIAADNFGVTSTRARDIHTASADWLATLSDQDIRAGLAEGSSDSEAARNC